MGKGNLKASLIFSSYVFYYPMNQKGVNKLQVQVSMMLKAEAK